MTNDKSLADNLKTYAPFVAFAIAVAFLIEVLFILPLRSSMNQKLAAMEARMEKAENVAKAAQQSHHQLPQLLQGQEALLKQLKDVEDRLGKGEEGRVALVADIAAARAQGEANKTTINDTIEWTRKSMVDLEAATRAAVAEAGKGAPMALTVPLVGERPAPAGVSSSPPALPLRPASKAARRGQPLASVEAHELKFDIMSIEQKGDSLIIETNITSPQKDESVTLTEYTKFYDQNSTEHYPEKIQLVDVTMINTDARWQDARKNLIKGLSAKATFYFKPEITVEYIPALIFELKVGRSDDKNITFRDLAVTKIN
jgi:hypothetical protein